MVARILQAGWGKSDKLQHEQTSPNHVQRNFLSSVLSQKFLLHPTVSQFWVKYGHVQDLRIVTTIHRWPQQPCSASPCTSSSTTGLTTKWWPDIRWTSPMMDMGTRWTPNRCTDTGTFRGDVQSAKGVENYLEGSWSPLSFIQCNIDLLWLVPRI